MWPSVPKIVPEKNLGTAYSLIYWVQNLGMWAVPIYIGRIFTDTITEAGNHVQEVQAAIHAEYIFILPNNQFRAMNRLPGIFYSDSSPALPAEWPVWSSAGPDLFSFR